MAARVTSSWIDIEAGLAKSGILRMPPDFCASAPWPPSQSISAVVAATAILHEPFIVALRAEICRISRHFRGQHRRVASPARGLRGRVAGGHYEPLYSYLIP